VPSFNLIREAWIPCLMLDGSAREFGLREVLARAHEIREVHDPSPLVTVTLHRLLLAVLRRKFGPANLNDWTMLWDLGAFGHAELDGYWEEMHDSFDLFDPERPFAQVPYMPDVEPSPIQRLVHEAASGNNPTLFEHSYTERPLPLAASVAARYLLALQGYGLGGGISKPFNFTDAPLARGYTVLALGENLFETLLLNLIDHPNGIRSTDQDRPIWERRLPAPDKDGTMELGLMDLLTWQSRRIHLIPDADGRHVTQVQVQQGLRVRPDLLEPFKAYERTKEGGYRPLTIQPERALWRDSHALLAHAEAEAPFKRPDLLDWLARVESTGRVKGAVQLAVLGMATEPGKATVLHWTAERLPLPLALLKDQGLMALVKAALEQAEAVAEVLEGAVFTLAAGLVRRDKDPLVAQLKAQLRPGYRYWSRLEGGFHRLLVDLPSEGEDALIPWGRTLREAAAGALTAILNEVGPNRNPEAMVAAERRFWGQLRQVPLVE
jgi:CRISPR system Cascade subunit CasA